MQAIILAAGMGRRLGEFTQSNTKCMVKVNGVRLINRMLNQLDKLRLSRIIIVTGYEGKNLRNYISSLKIETPIIFINNDIYDKTNNIYSLSLASDHLKEDDTLLLESDLILDDDVLKLIIEHPYPNIALVDKYQTWMDGTMVRIDDENNIINFIPKKAFKYSDTQFYYKTVNVYKFDRDFTRNHYLPFLEAYLKVLGENEYYEQVLRVITLIDNSNIKALPLNGEKWYEIDDVQDLRIAETIFADDVEKLNRLQHSYGGYWRYPYLLDFCYLVNPYFPRQRMIEEIKANFEPLLRNYPSGMAVNSMLAAKYFGLREENVCIGNGAAELIKSVIEDIEGNIGCIFPTFEEYPNRKKKGNIISFVSDKPDFSYNYNDLIHFYTGKEISALILVNPDNPSGNFIPINDVIKLIDWCEDNHITFILDESFVDFTDDFKNNSLLKTKILDDHQRLIIIKSISKSYGVPGLRLGVLASGNKDLINKTKKDVSIWNINSFAEFYLQIYSKYEKDYIRSCKKFIMERNRFFESLSSIPFLRVIPSQANYFLCECLHYTSHELTKKLLKYNILIKDCSNKRGFPKNKQFIRIAIRDKKDNDLLINAFKTI